MPGMGMGGPTPAVAPPASVPGYGPMGATQIANPAQTALVPQAMARAIQQKRLAAAAQASAPTRSGYASPIANAIAAGVPAPPATIPVGAATEQYPGVGTGSPVVPVTPDDARKAALLASLSAMPAQMAQAQQAMRPPQPQQPPVVAAVTNDPRYQQFIAAGATPEQAAAIVTKAQ